MPLTPEEIEDMIRESFPNAAKIRVTDTAGDGRHFAAEVVDESFRGKNRVEQHRAVKAALKAEMAGSHGALHALALSTKVPD